MSIKITNKHGNINIDEQVIASLAGISAMGCYGIVGMANKSATDGFFELLKKENITKGVKVTTKEEKLIIDLYVVLQYGIKISATAENIISTVKYTIEKYSQLEVSSVNVNVQGVRVQ